MREDLRELCPRMLFLKATICCVYVAGVPVPDQPQPAAGHPCGQRQAVQRPGTEIPTQSKLSVECSSDNEDGIPVFLFLFLS